MATSEEVREVVIEDEVTQRFNSQTFTMSSRPLCKVEPYNQIFPQGLYLEHHERIQEFEVFDDDVWIATFPKSGFKLRFTKI